MTSQITWILLMFCCSRCCRRQIGSLSSDHGDVNENDKKVIGLGPLYLEVGDPRYVK